MGAGLLEMRSMEVDMSTSTAYSSRIGSLSRATTPITPDVPPRFIHKCSRQPGKFANFRLSTDLLEPEDDSCIPSVSLYKQNRSRSVQRAPSPSTATTTPVPPAALPARPLLRDALRLSKPRPTPDRPKIRVRLRP